MVLGQALTAEGVLLSKGDGVNCPQLKLDSGDSLGVYGLPDDIAVGDRVKVSGTMRAVTTCLGLVLAISEHTVIARGGQ